MEELLAIVQERWGGWDGYAEAVGFPDETSSPPSAPSSSTPDRPADSPPRWRADTDALLRRRNGARGASPGEGEDLGAVVGDGDGVLEVGRAAAVAR